ncbi:hypothetical protein T484DRAFT_1858327 [Baffinella frigidus]|nr:hypothetical protein T484DRAFT_1858327 [Cryptophyta sp. CCMP2293]
MGLLGSRFPSGDWVDEPEGSAVTLDFRPPGPSARHTEAVAGPGSRLHASDEEQGDSAEEQDSLFKKVF